MLVPPPPGDGAGSLASGAGSSAAAATDAADAAGLAGEEDPVPDPPTGDLYLSRTITFDSLDPSPNVTCLN